MPKKSEMAERHKEGLDCQLSVEKTLKEQRTEGGVSHCGPRDDFICVTVVFTGTV